MNPDLETPSKTEPKNRSKIDSQSKTSTKFILIVNRQRHGVNMFYKFFFQMQTFSRTGNICLSVICGTRTCVYPHVNEQRAGVTKPLGTVLALESLEVGIVQPLVRDQALQEK